MPDDSHPADGLIRDIRGIFNGDTFIQGIKDAWDRHMAQQAPATPPDTSFHDSMVQAANNSFRNAANKVTPSSAASIRSRASKAVGQ